ncbi:hypothetical protein DM01DRAFT_1381269 [Hesseltinella vesiculosa]|uniref:Dolichol phosphate-mannose biosynthesis regulatory protein n=1 Tax=Hesseltinella vesiculosa TaxID=101127 RepID=A0A1X2GRG9_9FUNG|nr:hypothetical protein DM01DRAFT_1381269 [Hesseltinella vesiculosa]
MQSGMTVLAFNVFFFFLFFLPRLFSIHDYHSLSMTATDKIVGAGAFFGAWIIFIYYTLWALVMPFVDETNPWQAYFPAFEYAIRLPFATLVFGIIGIFGVFAYASSKQKTKQTKKAK